jgi:hypothetical protein
MRHLAEGDSLTAKLKGGAAFSENPWGKPDVQKG